MLVSMYVVTICALVYAVQLAAVAVVLVRLNRKLNTVGAAATTDPLTGLLDRRGLLAALDGELGYGTVLLDVARFKAVNDRWGHDTGDDLLLAVAQRLSHIATVYRAVVGRLGGDEFVLLLPGDPPAERLIEVARSVHDTFTTPVTLPGIAEPFDVRLVAGVAVAAAQPLPGKPFRAADIALYHARHHRQPYAVYQPGMVHPQTEQRHGERLRDRRPTPPVVVFDEGMFGRLAAGQVSSDVAHLDDLAELSSLLEVIDPRGRDFGSDAAELLALAIDHSAVRLAPSVTGLTLSPTVNGEHRDGGFLILAHIADAITLASAQLHPRDFTDAATPLPHRLLTAIAETANTLHDRYQATRHGGGNLR